MSISNAYDSIWQCACVQSLLLDHAALHSMHTIASAVELIPDFCLMWQWYA